MHSLEIFSNIWILALCAVFFAAFIRGLAGFGFALILAPILLLILSPTAVVVINLLLSMLSNILVLIRSFARIDIKRVLPIALSSLLGIPVGVWIISVIAPSVLRVFIGVVIICFAVLLAFGFRKAFAGGRLSSGVAGFFSGILSTSTSLGGPP
ncbi:MAG: sulfite exporter TauE/SafE family protein, partial [Gammaproteobacteria bacterium]|nr:sulfite exporter TauE/SafE family protein [Gammaproteobacteria bacterium]